MNQINTQLGELAQGGVLRVGVVYAPSMSTFFVEMDEQLTPYGPTVDLGKALAAWAGCSVEFHVVPNSGELADAVEAKEIDVAFMPMDDERKRRVAFGPSYFVIESTALVRANSNFQSTRDLNQKGVRAAGIANTTTIRNAERVLNAADVIPVTSVEEAMSALQEERVDAVVLSRDVLNVYEQKIPGSRVLEGTLHSTGIAIAVAKDRPVGLFAVSNFLENAKSSGLVRKIFDDAGFPLEPVAPSGM